MQSYKFINLNRVYCCNVQLIIPWGTGFKSQNSKKKIIIIFNFQHLAYEFF
jgi:hypothetical protein